MYTVFFPVSRTYLTTLTSEFTTVNFAIFFSGWLFVANYRPRLPLVCFLGHGGRQIADFLETALETNIINELKLTDDASILERLSR